MMKIKEFLAAIGAAVGAMAMGLSFSLININLDSIHQYFGASLVQLQWMINIYGIFMASLLVTMGRLGDIYGRKKIYLIGTTLFGISMLGAGLATTPTMIIFFMGIYGIAGSILLPLSQALLVEIFSDDKKGLAIGIWAAANGFSFAFGTIIGGVLLSFLSWRWIFFINVPFALIGFWMTAAYCRESKTEGESTKIDFPGAFLLTLAVSSFVLATVQLNLWSKGLIILLYLFSALCIGILLLVEAKVEMPVIREELFRSRTFLLCCLGNACMIAIFWAGVFLIPLYIQKILRFAPLKAGVLMLTFSLPQAIFSPAIGHLYRSFGPKILIGIGFCMLLVSAILQLQYAETTSTLYIAIATLLLGFGFTLAYTPTTAGALSAISRNYAGIATGTFMTIQEIGGNVGLAVSGTAARLGKSFASSFHNGIWVLLVLSLIGLLSAFLIPKTPKVLKDLS